MCLYGNLLSCIRTNERVASSVLMTAVQVVACGVEINDTQINVSGTTLQPLTPPPKPSEASWSMFLLPDNLTIDDPRLLAVITSHTLTLLSMTVWLMDHDL